MSGIRELAFNAAQRLDSWLRDPARRRRDLMAQSADPWRGGGIACPLIDARLLDVSGIEEGVARYLAGMYRSHRFDLLGSGWVSAGYDAQAVGVEGHRYTMAVGITGFDRDGRWLRDVLTPAHAVSGGRLWQMVDGHYQPIDWQRDFKSGFRWSTRTWFKDIDRTPAPGADIKIPWELARLQHLPQLALFALRLPELRPVLAQEFRDQVLDFIASNPVAMGVNWACTMDVAIRAANLLVAYDLFSQLDGNHETSAGFRDAFARSVHQHGRHITNNLEWSPYFTANHYLADIAGLLFVAAYLPPAMETDTWLAFAAQELQREIGKQFHDDGSNFEVSTSYHRFSGEMAVYATALLLGLPSERIAALAALDPQHWRGRPALRDTGAVPSRTHPLPDWYTRRLQGMARYSYDLTKPSGEVPQVGDNDGGRFLRLSPDGLMLANAQARATYCNLRNHQASDETYWDDSQVDHRPFLAACSGLLDIQRLEPLGALFPLEASLVRSLAHGQHLGWPAPAVEPTAADAGVAAPTLPHQATMILRPDGPAGPPLAEGLVLCAYPGSGVYILRSPRLHLTVSAGPNGQCGYGGHAHNDKLSFELQIDGRDFCRDPGTYLYSPLPEIRNRFRSVASHNTAVVNGIEQNRWPAGTAGLFRLYSDCRIRVLCVSPRQLAFQIDYRGVKHVRTFTVTNEAVIVTDRCNRRFAQHMNRSLFSSGYGKLLA
ncbi:MAG: alginate lyase family protein [Candidatus Edwardsbacteria bacterium]|nr:alginate lyase family protein [Candidatus Edwardsbacteria bacterium]